MTKQAPFGPLRQLADPRPSLSLSPSTSVPVLDVAMLVHNEEPDGPASLEARAGYGGCRPCPVRTTPPDRSGPGMPHRGLGLRQRHNHHLIAESNDEHDSGRTSRCSARWVAGWVGRSRGQLGSDHCQRCLRPQHRHDQRVRQELQRVGGQHQWRPEHRRLSDAGQGSSQYEWGILLVRPEQLLRPGCRRPPTCQARVRPVVQSKSAV